MEKDLQFVFKARHEIQSQAQDVLESGLEHLVNFAKLSFNLTIGHFSVESCADWYSSSSLLQSRDIRRSCSIDRKTSAGKFPKSHRGLS